MPKTGEVDALEYRGERLANVLVEFDVALRVLLAPAVEELVVFESENGVFRYSEKSKSGSLVVLSSWSLELVEGASVWSGLSGVSSLSRGSAMWQVCNTVPTRRTGTRTYLLKAEVGSFGRRSVSALAS